MDLDGVPHLDCDWDRLHGRSISGWKGEVDAEEDMESIAVVVVVLVVRGVWGMGKGGEEEEEKGRRREEFLCVGLGYKREGRGEDVGCFGWEWHAIFAVWF